MLYIPGWPANTDGDSIIMEIIDQCCIPVDLQCVQCHMYSVQRLHLMQGNNSKMLTSISGYLYNINCLISYREGLGMSLQIMGLATIDPHSQEKHTEIHRIPKCGVNWASLD